MTRRASTVMTAMLVAIGLLGMWVSAKAPLTEPQYDHAVGAVGLAAAVVGVAAVLRRSWARLPLVGVVALGGVLAWDGLVTAPDPYDMSPVVYFVLSVGIFLLSGAAALMMALDPRAAPSEGRGRSGA